MNVYTTHGAFSWCELVTTDTDGAKAFYAQLFGWRTRAVPTPNGTYTTARIGDTSIAGIAQTAAAADAADAAAAGVAVNTAGAASAKDAKKAPAQERAPANAGAPARPRAHWNVYVTVSDVDETLKQVPALGGKVIAPALDVPGVGRMAVIEDPQGARLAVITYSMPG